MKPLLSIVTPCHNSSTFVFRLLDSVLMQTYPNVEMVMIDNASADNTKEIILSYIPKFQAKGYSLIYHRQVDMGPSGGLKAGLRFIHGEFLTFPDSDDYYARPDALEIMADKLESLSNDFAIVRCQIQKIDDHTMQPCGIFGENVKEGDSLGLFEDCLYNRNGYYYVNIGYLMKVSDLREFVGLDFYTAYNVGPGRQIYCPLYFSKKCYTIKGVLSNYLVRKNSISHGDYAKYQVRKSLYEQDLKYFEGVMAPIHNLPPKKKREYKRIFMYEESMSIANLANLYNRSDFWKYRVIAIRYSNHPIREFLTLFKMCLKSMLT